MNLEKYFLLSWKKALIIIIAWFAAVILHNLTYALFYDFFNRTGGDEPVFFIIAVVIIPIYAIIAILYTLYHSIKKKMRYIEKIRVALTIFDISIIFAIVLVAYFSVISYYNANVAKTENYLKYFLLALKVIYYLGLIAFVHMIYSLIYFIYKKGKGKDEI